MPSSPIGIDRISKEHVCWRMGQAGLSEPFLPEPLASQLFELDDFCFTNFEPPSTPYELAMDLWPLDQEFEEDLLLVALDGRGVNSWGLHYILARRDILVILQKGWGGAYGSSVAEAWEIGVVFNQVESLLTHRSPSAERMIVVDTFYAKFWTPSDKPGTLDVGYTPEPLTDALDATMGRLELTSI